MNKEFVIDYVSNVLTDPNKDMVEKYNSVLQIQSLLTDTQSLGVESGRGSGKTTEIFAPRIVNISYSMPQSVMLMVAPTYTFIMDTIIPTLLFYLNTHYTRGIEYEYGKEPPKHFLRPFEEITRWNHTISFAWGTVIRFGSLDVPESTIGRNVVHVVVDEMLRIPEDDFVERVVPTLRGNKDKFGGSHHFGGITFSSSTPNFENDYDWWLQYEQNVNKEAIEEIMQIARRVMIARYELADNESSLSKIQKSSDLFHHKLESERLKKEIERLTRFLTRWEETLHEKRMKDAARWGYIRGSSFSNLAILGLDYMKRQLSGAKSNFDKFKLSILGIRPERVKEMFFAHFCKKHIYKDSYDLGEFKEFEANTFAGEFKRTSANLKYCDPNKPLLMGFDPGNFMSCVIGQERANELRVLKNFYVWTPKQHYDLAQDINEFFNTHNRKVIKLWSDRAGEQRKEIYKNNPKGKTDIAILKRCLEDLGWRVELMNPNQRTILYWEHYILLDVLLSEREKRTPKLRICQFECEQLISSIYMSPLKRTRDTWNELDKSSETKLDYEDQVWYSTQIPSALMYLIFGLYEKYKPAGIKEHYDIPGL